jgi:hypothetical protein
MSIEAGLPVVSSHALVWHFLKPKINRLKKQQVYVDLCASSKIMPLNFWAESIIAPSFLFTQGFSFAATGCPSPYFIFPAICLKDPLGSNFEA